MLFKTILSVFLISSFLFAQPVLEVKTFKKENEQKQQQLFDVRSAVKWVLKHHRELPTWELKLKTLKALRQDAGLLQNPKGKLSYQGDSILGGDGRQKMVLGIEQTLPLTDKRQREKTLAILKYDHLEAEYREWQRNMIYQVERTFFEWQFQQDKMHLLNEMIEHHSELTDFLDQKNKLGEINQHEVLQAQLELEFIQQEKSQMTTVKDQLERDLKWLLNLKDATIELVPSDKERPVSLSDDNILLEAHPMVMGQKVMIKIAKAKLALERTRQWNDLTVGLEWERERDLNPFGQAERIDSLGLELGVPLPFRKVNRGQLQASGISLESEKIYLKMIKDNLIQKKEQLVQRHKDIEYLMNKMNRSVVREIERHIELYTQAYQQGQVSLDRLMRAYDKLLEVKRQQLDLGHQKNLVWVEWRAVTAKNLESDF